MEFARGEGVQIEGTAHAVRGGRGGGAAGESPENSKKCDRTGRKKRGSTARGRMLGEERLGILQVGFCVGVFGLDGGSGWR